MNNYEFWENYLNNVINEIIKLSIKRKTLKIDLNIHSNYSADGKQTIMEIIDTTSQKGFDIISITDHDSLDAYNEIYKIVKNGLTKPIIIPGIEFTADNIDYGYKCHLLQLFVNPKDEEILKDIKINKTANFNRSKIQFRRLKENKALQKIFIDYDIRVSYMDYKNYLKARHLIPEYETLCMYLIEQLRYKGITNYNILDSLIKYNQNDPYIDRKKLKQNRYRELKNTFQENEENYYNNQLLLSLLAIEDVDDNKWNKPSSGSLSVNSYGQLKINEINKKYKLIFAHPRESKLEVVEKIIKENTNIIGLELNYKNNYKKISKFSNLLKKYNLIKTIGSNNHENTPNTYNDMSYYSINSKDILKLISKINEKET